jgi:hypothetical protein
LSTHLRLGLTSCFFASGFTTNILHAFLFSIRATCPAHSSSLIWSLKLCLTVWRKEEYVTAAGNRIIVPSLSPATIPTEISRLLNHLPDYMVSWNPQISLARAPELKAEPLIEIRVSQLICTGLHVHWSSTVAQTRLDCTSGQIIRAPQPRGLHYGPGKRYRTGSEVLLKVTVNNYGLLVCDCV